MGFKLEWHGMKYKDGLYNYMDKKVSKYADKLSKNTRDMAPKKTGKLKDSIKAVKKDRMQYMVRSDSNYASYVEYGTSKKQAHPFFRPALNITKGLK